MKDDPMPRDERPIMGPTPLKLRAEDEGDVDVLAAHLQDAIVPTRDIGYVPDKRQLVMVVNRFMWEHAGAAGIAEGGAHGDAAEPGGGAAWRGEAATETTEAPAPYLRTNCGLRIREVAGVQSRRLDLTGGGDRLLELLSLRPDPEGLVLHFAGGAAIRVQTSRISILLEDLGSPWPTARRPRHGGV